MFKQVFIILIILIIVYFVTKILLISSHKLYISPLKVKYVLNDSDSDYLKRYSTETDIFDLQPEDIFYTTKKWSTKNNNYFLFNGDYYIIEPGYYYFITDQVKLFLNNNCKIFVKKNKG